MCRRCGIAGVGFFLGEDSLELHEAILLWMVLYFLLYFDISVNAERLFVVHVLKKINKIYLKKKKKKHTHFKFTQFVAQL